MSLPDPAPSQTAFVRLSRGSGADATEVVVSRSAMHLHTFAVLTSVDGGSTGFVADHNLDALGPDTAVGAFELCLAGLWERVVGGYRVRDADTLAVAAEVHRRSAGPAEVCAGSGHGAEPEHAEVCVRCGSELTGTERRRTDR